jgi:hypothetical protein
MSRGRIAGLAFALLTFALPGLARAGPAFTDWAAVVVAGDWHAHSGGPSEAFDNARRDVARKLETYGFSPEHILQFSVRPEMYSKPVPGKSSVGNISAGLQSMASKARSGCLFYMSSHGAPEGALLDQDLLTPSVLLKMLNDACGSRPTIVIISTCFSGVFVPTLADPNRLIVTAARRDRTSFGCGESNRYPFFDDCFLNATAAARNFSQTLPLIRGCITAKETEIGVDTPSEPQSSLGANLAMILPLLSFNPH